MPQINIKIDIKLARSRLTEVVRKQLPFARAQAINTVAFEAQRAERAAMPEVFASPRPFTARSTLVAKATKAKPVAKVYIRREAAKYLQPFETGGLHVLPGKALLNPKDIRLDKYGQLAKGAPKRLAGRPDVFVGTVKTKSGPISGFWQRLPIKNVSRRQAKKGGANVVPRRLKLLIRFGEDLPVKKHLNFVVRAKEIVLAKFEGAFRSAMAKALSSAKK